FEMENFFEVLLSPVAISKFCHSTSSGFLLASLFVISISSWFLLKKRHQEMAKRSILVASVFGLLSSGFVAFTGDEAAYTSAKVQPMKLAAFEGLYKGEESAGLVAMGLLSSNKEAMDGQDPFIFEIKVPGMLSLLANRKPGSFVPGIEDLLYGNEEHGIMGIDEKIIKGKSAVEQLALYKQAKKDNNDFGAQTALAMFRENQEYMGFGYLNEPKEAVPPVPLTFYSFHVMVVLGSLFPVICLAFLIFTAKNTIDKQKWLLPIGMVSFFLAHVAGQAGWIVAEVGRQPWTIQDLLPVSVANSNLTTGTIQTTFFMFLVLFTLLLIAEIRIMLSQIKKGPEEI
ncbi:MAG: cytochrome ubiquinol oxidase subunit I, partial [Thermodesulfobacteriota bacterium]|nr:cytochrome ubiquinol oxidase subunit I [Thermodesulfobacteriota bacterium]